LHRSPKSAERISAQKLRALASALSLPAGALLDGVAAEPADVDLADVLQTLPLACRRRIVRVAVSLSA
jgi:hypothetical protein